MVNSGSFETTNDDPKSEYTTLETNVTTKATSPRHLLDSCSPEHTNYAATTAEMVSQKEEKPSQTANSENLTSLETKTSLQCSVPLHKVQNILKIKPKNEETAKSPKRLLCLFCDRTFIAQNLRQKHMDRCHSGGISRRFSYRTPGVSQSATACWYCSKLNHTDHSLSELLEHLVSDHSNRYFACLTCEERFTSQAKLKDHNKIVHNIEEIQEIVEDKEEKLDDSKNNSSLEMSSKNSPRKRTKNEIDVEEIVTNIIDPTLDEPEKISSVNKNSKKLSVKSTKSGVKQSVRTTRLQVKLLAKNKKRQKQTKKDSEPETTSSNNVYNSSSVFSLVNLFTYKYEKIYDHASDSIKDANSGKFDVVFDKEFYLKTVSNIKENLLFHLDGKLNRNVQSENRISNFEQTEPIKTTSENNFGSDVSLNAVTPVSLPGSSTYENFDDQIEYAAKATQKKSGKKDKNLKYKFPNRKFNSIDKNDTDLTTLDMWTQLLIKEKHRLAFSKPENLPISLQNARAQRAELNSILDKRGPFEDLRSEALEDSIKNKDDKSNSYSDVNIILEEILTNVFKVESKQKNIVEIKEEIENDLDLEIPSYFKLQKSPNKNEIKIDTTDKSTMICIAKDSDNQSVELTGEWARPRIYICATCALKLPNLKALEEHKNISHPNIWCQHYEFVGKQSEFYRHLGIPGLGKVGVVEKLPVNKNWVRSDARSCTKCAKVCHNLGELHRHILECGGDWQWMLARKKCKYRPYGTRRRRQRGYKRTCNPDIPRAPRGPRPKAAHVGPRPKPSDAETIQRMLANLPAKRNRKMISMRDGIQPPRKPYISRTNLRSTSTIHSENAMKVNSQSQRILRTRLSHVTNQVLKNNLKRKMNARVLRSRNNIIKHQEESDPEENIKDKRLSTRMRIATRTFNRVLGSKILDTNTTLVSRRQLAKSVIQKTLRTRLRSKLDTKTSEDIEKKRTLRKRNEEIESKTNTEVKEVKKKSVGKRLLSLVTSKPKKLKTEDNKPTEPEKPRKKLKTEPKTTQKTTSEFDTLAAVIDSVAKNTMDEYDPNRISAFIRKKATEIVKNVKNIKKYPEKSDVSNKLTEKSVASKLKRTLSMRKSKRKKDIKIVEKTDEKIEVNVCDISINDSKNLEEDAKKNLDSKNDGLVENVCSVNEINNDKLKSDEIKSDDTEIMPTLEKIDRISPKLPSEDSIPILSPIITNAQQINPTESNTVKKIDFSEIKSETIKKSDTKMEESKNSALSKLKNKFKRSGRGLNDCIAMLKNKLEKKSDPQIDKSNLFILNSCEKRGPVVCENIDVLSDNKNCEINLKNNKTVLEIPNLKKLVPEKVNEPILKPAEFIPEININTQLTTVLDVAMKNCLLECVKTKCAELKNGANKPDIPRKIGSIRKRKTKEKSSILPKSFNDAFIANEESKILDSDDDIPLSVLSNGPVIKEKVTKKRKSKSKINFEPVILNQEVKKPVLTLPPNIDITKSDKIDIINKTENLICALEPKEKITELLKVDNNLKEKVELEKSSTKLDISNQSDSKESSENLNLLSEMSNSTQEISSKNTKMSHEILSDKTDISSENPELSSEFSSEKPVSTQEKTSEQTKMTSEILSENIDSSSVILSENPKSTQEKSSEITNLSSENSSEMINLSAEIPSENTKSEQENISEKITSSSENLISEILAENSKSEQENTSGKTDLPSEITSENLNLSLELSRISEEKLSKQIDLPSDVSSENLNLSLEMSSENLTQEKSDKSTSFSETSSEELNLTSEISSEKINIPSEIISETPNLLLENSLEKINLSTEILSENLNISSEKPNSASEISEETTLENILTEILSENDDLVQISSNDKKELKISVPQNLEPKISTQNEHYLLKNSVLQEKSDAEKQNLEKIIENLPSADFIMEDEPVDLINKTLEKSETSAEISLENDSILTPKKVTRRGRKSRKRKNNKVNIASENELNVSSEIEKDGISETENKEKSKVIPLLENNLLNENDAEVIKKVTKGRRKKANNISTDIVEEKVNNRRRKSKNEPVTIKINLNSEEIIKENNSITNEKENIIKDPENHKETDISQENIDEKLETLIEKVLETPETKLEENIEPICIKLSLTDISEAKKKNKRKRNSQIEKISPTNELENATSEIIISETIESEKLEVKKGRGRKKSIKNKETVSTIEEIIQNVIDNVQESPLVQENEIINNLNVQKKGKIRKSIQTIEDDVNLTENDDANKNTDKEVKSSDILIENIINTQRKRPNRSINPKNEEKDKSIVNEDTNIIELPQIEIVPEKIEETTENKVEIPIDIKPKRRSRKNISLDRKMSISSTEDSSIENSDISEFKKPNRRGRKRISKAENLKITSDEDSTSDATEIFDSNKINVDQITDSDNLLEKSDLSDIETLNTSKDISEIKIKRGRGRKKQNILNLNDSNLLETSNELDKINITIESVVNSVPEIKTPRKRGKKKNNVVEIANNIETDKIVLDINSIISDKILENVQNENVEKSSELDNENNIEINISDNVIENELITNLEPVVMENKNDIIPEELNENEKILTDNSILLDDNFDQSCNEQNVSKKTGKRGRKKQNIELEVTLESIVPNEIITENIIPTIENEIEPVKNNKRSKKGRKNNVPVLDFGLNDTKIIEDALDLSTLNKNNLKTSDENILENFEIVNDLIDVSLKNIDKPKKRNRKKILEPARLHLPNKELNNENPKDILNQENLDTPKKRNRKKINEKFDILNDEISLINSDILEESTNSIDETIEYVVKMYEREEIQLNVETESNNLNSDKIVDSLEVDNVKKSKKGRRKTQIIPEIIENKDNYEIEEDLNLITVENDKNITKSKKRGRKKQKDLPNLQDLTSEDFMSENIDSNLEKSIDLSENFDVDNIETKNGDLTIKSTELEKSKRKSKKTKAEIITPMKIIISNLAESTPIAKTVTEDLNYCQSSEIETADEEIDKEINFLNKCDQEKNKILSPKKTKGKRGRKSVKNDENDIPAIKITDESEKLLDFEPEKDLSEIVPIDEIPKTPTIVMGTSDSEDEVPLSFLAKTNNDEEILNEITENLETPSILNTDLIDNNIPDEEALNDIAELINEKDISEKIDETILDISYDIIDKTDKLLDINLGTSIEEVLNENKVDDFPEIPKTPTILLEETPKDDYITTPDLNNTSLVIKIQKKLNCKLKKAKRGRKKTNILKIVPTKVEEQKVYCEICNKSFTRMENLIKHKRTLTHISKLSEIEARENAQKQITEVKEIQEEKLDLVVEELLQKDENVPDILEEISTDLEKSETFPVIINNKTANLKLVDIINDVLDKPTNLNLPESILSKNIPEKTKRYKSMAERKSFDSDTYIPKEQITENEFSSQTNNQILSKQLSLLENIIEKTNPELNYIEDSISYASNHFEETVPVREKNIFRPDYPIKQIKFSHSNDIISSFIKPDHFTNFENAKLQKTNNFDENSQQDDKNSTRKKLNRDEELFLECCSLLKSGSEISNSKKATKFVEAWTDQKHPNNFIQRDLSWLAQGSRVETPIGEPYVNNDWSNSNSAVSSEWLAQKAASPDQPVENNTLSKKDNNNSENFSNIQFEDISLESSLTRNTDVPTKENVPLDFHNVQFVKPSSENEELLDQKNAPDDNLVENDDENDGKDEIVEEVDENLKRHVVSAFGGLMANALKCRLKAVVRRSHKAKEKRTFISTLQPVITDYVVPVKKSKTNTDITSEVNKNSNDGPKKIQTKGAMKVFEGIKVSIPTQDLNLTEVLKSTNFEQKEELQKNETEIITNKKKNVFKNFGNKLGLKETKKKNNKKEKTSNADIYDFQESEDSASIKNKPLTVFRNICTENTTKNNTDLESESETDRYYDSISYEENSLSSDSIEKTNITKVKEISQSKKDTQKKCMIMGRIFKNASKPKLEDKIPEIRDISSEENSKIIENYLDTYSSLDNIESTIDGDTVIPTNNLTIINSKNKMSTKEMDFLFDKLLNDQKTISETPKITEETSEETKKQLKNIKPKKRRHNSDNSASSEEFTLTGKPKTSKKHKKQPRKPKKQNGGINLEQEMKECIGVAGRKSQRKCTSGKQNVLVEYWSSDESIDEIIKQNEMIKDSTEIVEEKKDLYEFLLELDEVEEPIVPLHPPKEIPEKVLEKIVIENIEKPKMSRSKEEGDIQRVSKQKRRKKRTNSEGSNIDTVAKNRRKRNAVETLYYWSSTSDDEQHDLIEVKPIREDTEEERPMQHGWIVGDSPKKLVTMLAQAKGHKKIDCESVKEQNKKSRTTL